jgi:hypothetical protein
MKITIIGNGPIFLDKERADAVKQAIINGQEYIDIDGNFIRCSSISAITDEDEPSKKFFLVGQSPSKNKRLEAPKGDGSGYKKFQEMKRRFGL